MDSITQAALGAAVGEAVAGKKVGRKASLWGAVCGTLPDLDVLIPMGDPVRDFTYHRAESHSIFYLTLVTPLIVWLITRIHPGAKQYRGRWTLLILLVFYTHVLLDSFTVYGTQIFLPFTNYPVGWSTIFIIDPLYTLPLLAGVLALLFLKKSPQLSRRVNYLGLAISTIYLFWSLFAMLHVKSVTAEALDRQGIHYTRLLSGPTPFNTLLWRSIAMTDSGYVEGFYSLLKSNNEIRFHEYPSSPELLNPIADDWHVRRLQWFTKGFYKVEKEDDKIIISDLRMGVEPQYFFRFAVGRFLDGEIITQPPEQVDPPETDMRESLNRLWDRL